MAAYTWMATSTDAEATVELRQDGTARVICGTPDIGGGTSTVVAQMVSHETGVPVHRVEVVLGDSSLPAGPISAGSWATASLPPAVPQAARTAATASVLAATKASDSP